MERWKRGILAEIILFFILISLNNSFVLAFISIIAHEAAHIVIAKKNGCKFNDIQIHIYGAKAQFVNIEELSKKEKLQIYLAGPITNFIIIFIFFFLSLISHNIWITRMVNININLLIFNLLPAYPLDGSRILEIILSNKMLYKRANSIVSKISYIIAIGLFVIFIMAFLYKGIINISLLIASIVVGIITRTEQKSAMYILMGNIFMENKSISVYYKQGLANIMSIIDKNRFNIFYVLDDDLNVLFIMNEDELIKALKGYGNITLEEYFYIRNKQGI